MSKSSSPVSHSTCRVLYGDTDAAGIVYHANYLRFFELGRSEFMREWVVSYKEIEDLGFVLPVTECFTRFKAPAYYDDILTVETTFDSLRRVSFKFNYRITRKNGNNGRPKLLVKGYTVHASVNREGKLIPLPDTIHNRLAELLQD